MSHRQITETPAVEPSPEAVPAVTPSEPTEQSEELTVAAAPPAKRKRRTKAVTAETTTASTPEPPAAPDDEPKPPLSAGEIAASCRILLVDYLAGPVGLPPFEAEAAAERAVRALVRAPAGRDDTKLARLVALLRRREGATLAEMVAATGWQAHSVRGALSGTLKKKHGLAVTSAAGAAGRVYRLPAEG